jgi:hypothetical protein
VLYCEDTSPHWSYSANHALLQVPEQTPVCDVYELLVLHVPLQFVVPDAQPHEVADCPLFPGWVMVALTVRREAEVQPVVVFRDWA